MLCLAETEDQVARRDLTNSDHGDERNGRYGLEQSGHGGARDDDRDGNCDLYLLKPRVAGLTIGGPQPELGRWASGLVRLHGQKESIELLAKRLLHFEVVRVPCSQPAASSQTADDDRQTVLPIKHGARGETVLRLEAVNFVWPQPDGAKHPAKDDDLRIHPQPGA